MYRSTLYIRQAANKKELIEHEAKLENKHLSGTERSITIRTHSRTSIKQTN